AGPLRRVGYLGPIRGVRPEGHCLVLGLNNQEADVIDCVRRPGNREGGAGVELYSSGCLVGGRRGGGLLGERQRHRDQEGCVPQGTHSRRKARQLRGGWSHALLLSNNGTRASGRSESTINQAFLSQDPFRILLAPGKFLRPAPLGW